MIVYNYNVISKLLKYCLFDCMAKLAIILMRKEKRQSYKIKKTNMLLVLFSEAWHTRYFYGG